jgi:membrane glycosyltransferase
VDYTQISIQAVAILSPISGIEDTEQYCILSLHMISFITAQISFITAQIGYHCALE